jgi:hypothetical protein
MQGNLRNVVTTSANPVRASTHGKCAAPAITASSPATNTAAACRARSTEGDRSSCPATTSTGAVSAASLSRTALGAVAPSA